jgi:hypothetical protein
MFVCGPHDRDVMMPRPGIKLKMISMAEKHPTTYTHHLSRPQSLSLFLVYYSSVCAINNTRSQLFMHRNSESFFYRQIDEEHKKLPKTDMSITNVQELRAIPKSFTR